MKQLLNAVSYCHSRNIVHRDLKPENLLLTSNRKSIKVIDFGASTIMHEKFLNKKYGTSYYVAPEVLRGIYNEKCDIWSIGVIFYIMLSGKPPFPGKDDKEILRKVEIGMYQLDGSPWNDLSSEAIDLLRRLLNYNPNTRISAAEALEHPWFQKFSGNDMVKIKESIPRLALEQLSQFHCSQKLQNAVLTFIASQLSQNQDFQEITEIFKILDKNGDGRISQEELKAIYEHQGMSLMLGNPEQIMKEVDVNRSGYIDYTEFIIACKRRELATSISSLEATFKVFDIDRNGRITAQELKEAIGDAGSKDIVWKNLIQGADLNGDGELDLEEFKTMMIQLLNN